MLESITWLDYLEVLAIIIIVYYAVFGILFHRKGISITVTKTTDPEVPKKQEFAAPYEQDDDEAGEEDADVYEDNKPQNLYDELEEIVTDIRHSILEEAGKGADKEMLLEQLKSRVANYGGLRQPAYQVALNNFIIQHADSICGVVFTEDELEEAWATLPR